MAAQKARDLDPSNSLRVLRLWRRPPQRSPSSRPSLPSLCHPTMSTPSEPPNPPPSSNAAEKAPAQPSSSTQPPADGAAPMETDAPTEEPVVETWEDLPEEIRNSSPEEIMTRIRLIENDIKVCTPFLLTNAPVLANSLSLGLANARLR